ncbi:universal stress protein [Halovenus sp. WSH3]|uniref:Universal stress protein n=1 Tax=Halovenus carboxidivorans TaxID=2692199 RepID=A0A6B0T476_9EURY|nr:universal stress protein [Halovenus carboxidivorans]MXR50976.1 universal stress protein [Halovenus carboxidivorans]
MYERILHPTDGSTGTAHVTLQAIDLAKQYDATVYALHVVDSDVTSLLTDVGRDRAALDERGQKAVRSVERMCDAHGVDAETAVLDGDPAETILEYADEIEADLIVSGTHGRSGVRRQVLGSVAERLVRHATVPVMTVRLPETDVTVEDGEHAESLAREALADAGYDAEITDVTRQLTVWVIHARADGRELLVYLDPETQRTSVID